MVRRAVPMSGPNEFRTMVSDRVMGVLPIPNSNYELDQIAIALAIVLGTMVSTCAFEEDNDSKTKKRAKRLAQKILDMLREEAEAGK